MREAFAHQALLVMDAEADARAPGAAITVALCGNWQHEPPCPLAPHHSHAERVDGDVQMRTLFAVEPAKENLVRRLIDSALTAGELAGPDGVTTRWRVAGSERSSVRPTEAAHAQRLIQG